MTQWTPPRPSLMRAARRFCASSLILGSVVVVLFDLMLVWIAVGEQRRFAQSYLVYRITIAGEISSVALNRTLAQLPRRDAPPLQPFLETQLNNLPDLDYIVLVTPATDSAIIATRPGLSPPAAARQVGGRGGRSLQVEGAAVDFALRLPGTPDRWLHVGCAGRPDRSASWLAVELAVLLFIALLATAALLWRLCRMRLLIRLERIHAAAARGAAGDWRIALADGGMDNAGRLAAAVDAIVTRTNGQWAHLLWLAAEVARAVPDHSVEIRERLVSLEGAARFCQPPFGPAQAPDAAGTAAKKLE
jgi:hypothetical protein